MFERYGVIAGGAFEIVAYAVADHRYPIAAVCEPFPTMTLPLSCDFEQSSLYEDG